VSCSSSLGCQGSLGNNCVSARERDEPPIDDDDKLVVIPEGRTLDDAEIAAAVAFQERFFASEVLRR
jgi:hypothetical protein